MAEMATSAVDSILGMLDDGVDPPPSLGSLKAAISEGEATAIAQMLYTVLSEQTLDYDVSEDGKLVPTVADYSNKEDALALEKMSYIYTYGIKMYKSGILDGESLKKIVLERLAGRVGMDGPQFDKWLAIPAVE